jgi:hypothetical protein
MRALRLLILCLWVCQVEAAEDIRRFDTDGDGNFDQWEIRVDGQLTRMEADLNHDTRVDYWMTYKQGKPVKAQNFSLKSNQYVMNNCVLPI